MHACQLEIEQIYQKGIDVADKAWNFSKDVKDLQSLTESLNAEP